MLKYYIRTAFRYLYRNRGITLINITGLAIGVAVFILIMHYVQNELSYDRFNEKQETVCRLEWLRNNALTCWTTSAMGFDAMNAIPEIKDFFRIQTWSDFYLDYKENKFPVEYMSVVDSSIFNFFDLEMIQGDPGSALTDPFTVVLTESFARKIFGSEDPVGETLKTSYDRDLTITGVVKDPPNFHLKFDVLLSFVTLGAMYGEERLYTYRTYQYSTYYLLEDKANIDTVSRKLDIFFHQLFYDRYGHDDDSLNYHAYARPLKDIYFARDVASIDMRTGNKQYVVIFTLIAIFIIVIACINFINLSTARASLRSMEVGIKKVVGSGRRKLILQFLGESVVITLIGSLLGLLLVELAFPVFENIIGADLRIAYLERPVTILLVLGGIITVGVLAGLYPAFYLTAFNPVMVLKGEKTTGRSAGMLRKILIVFQFSISIILIIGTIIVYKQLSYLRNKDKGFNTEQLVTMEMSHEIAGSKELFKENLLRYPNITGVTYSFAVPGQGGNWEGFSIEGNDFNPNVYSVDPDYLDVMGIELLKGRNLSWDMARDSVDVCLVNEESARNLNMDPDSLLGKFIDHPRWYITVFPIERFQIIGIMKDFHFKSLRTPIEPLIFGWNEDWFNFVNIKISGADVGETLKIIENEWKNFSPDIPFEYTFMDENFDRLYRTDQKLGKIFRYFAGLAIFIAILGLFGLAAFIATQRTKEIGIRKAMGASSSRISFILAKEFTVLILISSVIAWPVAWYWAKNWLQEFAYKTRLSWEIFLIATLAGILVALITVVTQTLKAANTNPSDALRYE
jgi:putative ABC transport system permease protein